MITRVRSLARRIRRGARAEDGQALVEFALVVPLLLLLVLGIIDFGRAINYWNDENHVANMGARFAIVGSAPNFAGFPPTTNCVQPSDLVSLVRYEACLDSPELYPDSSPGSNGVQTPVSVCVTIPSTNAIGDPITVKVSTSYKWLPVPSVSFLGIGGNFATSTLTGTATMRLEQPAQSWVTSAPACA